MTDYFTPAGNTTFDAMAPSVIGSVTERTSAAIVPVVMQLPGILTLEQVSVTRGQAWPQGVPRKSGYVP